MKRTNRRLRLAFAAVSVVAVIVAVGSIVYLLSRNSESGLPVGLSILWAVMGTVWAGTGVAANFVAIRANAPSSRHRDLIAPVLVASDAFVDRELEVGHVAEAIDHSRCANCFGNRGIGKSHLLAYIADVINGHRRRDNLRNVPTDYAAAIYVDLAEASGFDEVVEQVSAATFPQAASWPELISQTDRRFGPDSVLLILDNVNSRATWEAIGRASYRYLARRTNDAVLFGSVEPMVFHNIDTIPIPLETFDLASAAALARVDAPDLSDDEIRTLHEQSDGLPVFLRLLLANRTRPRANASETPTGLYIRDAILPGLADDVVQLLAHVVVAAHAVRLVPVSWLRHLALGDLDRRIEELKSTSLVTVLSRPRECVLRIHDIFRDDLVPLLTAEIGQAARSLQDLAEHDERDLHSAIFVTFGDPKDASSRSGNIVDLLKAVVAEQSRAGNYAALDLLASRIESNQALLVHLRDAEELSTLGFAKGSALAGVGRYDEAAMALNMTPTPMRRQLTEVEMRLEYLRADVAHLQNRYDQAFEMFEYLCATAAERDDAAWMARCLWGQGRVLRHQGRELSRALDLFDSAAEFAVSAEDRRTEVAAVTNGSGVRVYLGSLRADELDILSEIEIATGTGDSVVLDQIKIWKAQARVWNEIGEASQASRTLDRAIKAALALNDRGLFNLYFERAEFARRNGDEQTAQGDLRTVETFANGNGDRNLIANCLLASASLAASMAQTPFEIADVRASILRGRDVALSAGIYGTVHAAERLLEVVATTPDEASAKTRLIVF